MAQHLPGHRIGRNVSRPGSQERNLYGGVVHILRVGAVSLAPDAVVTHVHAVVGGKDHKGVLIQTGFPQLGKDLPDARVHGADRGIVAGQAFAASLRAGLIGRGRTEPRMQRLIRRAFKGAVPVQIQEFLRVMLRRPGRGARYSGRTGRRDPRTRKNPEGFSARPR